MGTETTEQREDRIARRYREGRSLRAISADEGVTVETIRKVLVRHGVPRRGRGLSPVQRRVMQERRNEQDAAAAAARREDVQRELYHARGDGELRALILRDRAAGKEPEEIAAAHGLMPETVKAIQGEATLREIREALG